MYLHTLSFILKMSPEFRAQCRILAEEWAGGWQMFLMFRFGAAGAGVGGSEGHVEGHPTCHSFFSYFFLNFIMQL